MTSTMLCGVCVWISSCAVASACDVELSSETMVAAGVVGQREHLVALSRVPLKGSPRNRARGELKDLSRHFVLDPNRKEFSHGVGLPWAVRSIEKLEGEVRYRSFIESDEPWVEFSVIVPIRPSTALHAH